MTSYFSLRTIFICLSMCCVLWLASDVDARTTDDQVVADILKASNERNSASPAIQAGLISNQVSIQKQAILALGRIGGPNVSKTLAAFLYSPQPDVRQQAAYALAIAGDIDAIPALMSRLKSENNATVLAEIIAAIGLLGPHPDSHDIIAVILRYLDHEDPHLVTASCDALSYAWQIHRTTISVPNSTQVNKLLQLSAQQPQFANHCLYALTRIRTEVALFEETRLHQTLATLTTDFHHQLMVMILAEQGSDRYQDYILSHFHDSASASLMALAAQALAQLPPSKQTDAAITDIIAAESEFLQHPYIRIGLLDGLGQLAPDDRRDHFLKQLTEDSSEWVKSRAVAMLYATKPEAYLTEMQSLLNSDRITTQSVIVSVAVALKSEHSEQLLSAARKSEYESIRDMVSRLDDPEAQQAKVSFKTTTEVSEIKTYISRRLMIKTTKGDVSIQLLPSAPYTSYNFYQLAIQGYYDDSEFHRVIPGFVVQGGDVKATNQDGPGYRIADELYPIRHLKGTVGMAKTDKDTAGAGFYFNLKDNFHLDRRYTVFARVITGMSVVQQLTVGDRILAIEDLSQAVAR